MTDILDLAYEDKQPEVVVKVQKKQKVKKSAYRPSANAIEVQCNITNFNTVMVKRLDTGLVARVPRKIIYKYKNKQYIDTVGVLFHDITWF